MIYILNSIQPRSSKVKMPEEDGDVRFRKRLATLSSEELLKMLVERKQVYSCVCGTYFKSSTSYYLHRGSHGRGEDGNLDPLKCSFCNFEAADKGDFLSHLYRHKGEKWWGTWRKLNRLNRLKHLHLYSVFTVLL